MSIIMKLKACDVTRMDLDDMISLAVEAKLLRQGYTEYGAEPPEWLSVRITALDRHIRNAQYDFVEMRLAEARARLEAMKPDSVKREELEQQIEALKARLSPTSSR